MVYQLCHDLFFSPFTDEVDNPCYGKKQEWDDREEAQAYFLEAMMNSDGAEHDRYSGIYIQLQNGLDYCTDEDDDEEDES